MRQYLYISTAGNLSDAAVDEIIETSQRNNAASGITGLLFYNNRNFLQLVEGEDAALKSLMARIASDPRHSGIVVLDNSMIGARNCEGWAMRRFMTSEDVAARRFTVLSELPGSLSEPVRDIILNFAKLN